MIRIGVIGYGYWGTNIVRNFNIAEGAQVVAVCDSNNASLNKVKKLYPAIRTMTDSNEIVMATDVDAIAVITPVSSHFSLAKKALENGKHVFVEKPFTASVKEAEELIELAAKKKLTIMVDHTFLFTGAVRKIKELVSKNELGNVYYYDSTRVNLGLFQHDVNVIWDLAPHDFSIMSYVINEKPDSLIATGISHIKHFNDLENIAFVTVHFNSNIIAHFNVNWLSPVKIRNTLIGGEKKMLLWDDISADEKIKIYDKGVDVKNKEGIYNLLVSYRSGDVWVPKIEQTEALKIESEYFVECVTKNKAPINDGHAGLMVVRMLEACNESLRNKGKVVKI
ncbi:MAG: Gfo/Idh/MocA family oxidoreductase [Chitinivibrionales bacterium]|nr:Gfo/Idh/MocA family oxidoreductase [Chitinivibrionales bacterium]